MYLTTRLPRENLYLFELAALVGEYWDIFFWTKQGFKWVGSDVAWGNYLHNWCYAIGDIIALSAGYFALRVKFSSILTANRPVSGISSHPTANTFSWKTAE